MYGSLIISPGDVGVGGYLLGGGLSPLSAEYGFGCDSVINYEVVLASGSIINVNATSEPELFFALKGGSNQFGKCSSLNQRSSIIISYTQRLLTLRFSTIRHRHKVLAPYLPHWPNLGWTACIQCFQFNRCQHLHQRHLFLHRQLQ